MVDCKRCGKCCYRLIKTGIITNEKCKYLIILKNGRTLCRIYKNRLGTKTHENNVCGLRTAFPFNIKGCPQNREEWPEAIDKSES
jgi:hypothetical protein